jgi:predicted esterase
VTPSSTFHALRPTLAALLPAVLLLGCSATPSTTASGNAQRLPQLSAATASPLSRCDDLATRIDFPHTRITDVTPVAAGTLKVAGQPVRAHCQVTGHMFERVSPVDGQGYAIGFEMRLPNDWNGRFFYQANGGIDGRVVPATGGINGGGALDNALNMGFAVISSDAGHNGKRGPLFGIDPQARLDYGYQAAAQLTPMAKSAIKTAYGKAPDRSYFGGCSNGGRHAMVAASRLADQYDGYLVGNPGFNLPQAAIASIAGAQIYAQLATQADDLGTAFTLAERQMVSNAVLDKCDALDGAQDGLVQDTAACQVAFNLERDVPSCASENASDRTGSCLSAAQKTGIAKIFSGPTNRQGRKFYTSFPYDNGLAGAGYGPWEFSAPIERDSGAVAFIWSVPPEDPASFNGRQFALKGSLDAMQERVNTTSARYPESGMQLMTPPRASELVPLKVRGAKMMVYHGTADPIFSSDDTAAWYEALRSQHQGDASAFARFYRVPGMNHCSGGPATDQFDMLTPLVHWVEKGQAPDAVVAHARGTGNAAGANADVPANWSASRTRPLCAYPQVARYKGQGDLENASSFSCQ